MHSGLIPEAVRGGQDPIFALGRIAKERAATGADVVDATLGLLTDDDGRPALVEAAFDAMERVSREQAACYTPVAGPPEFLEAVVDDVCPEFAEYARPVATPGASGAIFAAAKVFAGTGGRAIVPNLYWGPYSSIIDSVGGSLRTFNLFRPDFTLDVDALLRAANQEAAERGRAFIVLNFPCNNPTGYSPAAVEWDDMARAVAELGREAPVTVLLDDAYSGYEQPETAEQSLAAWTAAVGTMLETATVLVAWTISKNFTQYGARVGALVALHRDGAERERLAGATGYVCRTTWSNTNHLWMLAATLLLTDPSLAQLAAAQRKRLVEMLRARAAHFASLAAGAGLRHAPYSGGFFTTVATANGSAAAAAMRDENVFAIPMDTGVRIALCSTPVRQIGRVVAAAARAVSA